ncbi:MAG: hypothetical protein KAY65_09965 [Planctomycetes bacterium]|nr:hypothetical protein [Planctomycetota bacterium]
MLACRVLCGRPSCTLCWKDLYREAPNDS